jgi:toxin FitB
MIVFDTNVVSELMKESADRNVVRWANSLDPDSIYLSTMVLAELLAGLGRLSDGKRKNDLVITIDALENESFSGRLLVFNANCARHYGIVIERRYRAGRPIATADAIIAATALAYGASLATRNTRDFEGLDIELINPFGDG